MAETEKEDLPKEVETCIAALCSLREEVDAAEKYIKRLNCVDDELLKKVIQHNLDEEVEHIELLYEWLRRYCPAFKKAE
jgi:hypothetical protein